MLRRIEAGDTLLVELHVPALRRNPYADRTEDFRRVKLAKSTCHLRSAKFFITQSGFMIPEFASLICGAGFRAAPVTGSMSP